MQTIHRRPWVGGPWWTSVLRADTGAQIPFAAVLSLDFAGHTLPPSAEVAPTQGRLSDLSCFPSLSIELTSLTSDEEPESPKNTGLSCGIVGLPRGDERSFLSHLKPHFMFVFVNNASGAEWYPAPYFLDAKGRPPHPHFLPRTECALKAIDKSRKTWYFSLSILG